MQGSFQGSLESELCDLIHSSDSNTFDEILVLFVAPLELLFVVEMGVGWQ